MAPHRHGDVVLGGNGVERAGQTPPVEKIRRARGIRHARARRFPDAHDPGSVRERQRLDQHGIDQAEHRGRRADTEGQHRDHDRREAGVAAEQLDSVGRVLQQDLEPADTAPIAMGLGDSFDAAESQPCAASRFASRQARRDAVGLGHLEVSSDFALELAIETASPKKRGELMRDPADVHAFASRTRATSAVAFSQFATSTRSWRAPVFVSE